MLKYSEVTQLESLAYSVLTNVNLNFFKKNCTTGPFFSKFWPNFLWFEWTISFFFQVSAKILWSFFLRFVLANVEWLVDRWMRMVCGCGQITSVASWFCARLTAPRRWKRFARSLPAPNFRTSSHVNSPTTTSGTSRSSRTTTPSVPTTTSAITSKSTR